jgi:hypothetical protein
MNESPSLTKFYDITKKGNNQPFAIRISSKEHLYSRSRNSSNRSSQKNNLKISHKSEKNSRIQNSLEQPPKRIPEFEKNVTVLEVESNEEIEGSRYTRSKRSHESEPDFVGNNLLSQKYSTSKPKTQTKNFQKKSIDYISEEYPLENSLQNSNSSEDVTMSDEHEFSIDPFQNKKFVNSHNLNEDQLQSMEQRSQESYERGDMTQIETGRGTKDSISMQHIIHNRHHNEESIMKQESKVIARPFEQVHSYQVHTISRVGKRGNGR